ncbi:hypothetical protein IWQ61_002536 [Dispira simplex]|nr:hypothetical protein IWQ61_002536 [Dispira simplex]
MTTKSLHGALQDLVTEAQELTLASVTELTQLPAPLEFMRYVARNQPFIVRDGAKDWPALKKWSNEYLKQRLGEQLVTVAITPNGYADAIVDDRYFVEPYQTQMPFSQVIDKICSGQTNTSTNPSSVDTHYYVQSQNGNLVGEFSPLRGDVPGDIAFASIALDKRPDAVNFWMGEASSVTSLHKDPYENIYVVVAGSKQFTLYPPTEGYVLYEKQYTAAEYQLTPATYGQTPKWSLHTHPDAPRVPWLAVDPLDNGISARRTFPRFYELARPLHATVHAGDMFYLPALWYHHVQQRQDDLGRVIAVNYWYDMDYSAPLYPFFNFTQQLIQTVDEDNRLVNSHEPDSSVGD